MSETYTKNLNEGEYSAIYKLCEFFDGSEIARVVGSKINKKISTQVSENSKVEPEVDENGLAVLDENGVQKKKNVPPQTIQLVLTRPELDGFFIGVKESIAKNDVKATDINLIGEICKVLGMSSRFHKHIDRVVDSLEKDNDQLDDEIVIDPLD